MPPNVLLLVLDAARRDAFEPYGAPAGSSPAVAQLASRGWALPDVYATSCWTVPSHASIFSGLLPRAAGLSRVPDAHSPRPVMEGLKDRLLPEVLRRAGYDTAAASANLWVSAGTGFDVGFDELVEVDSGRNARIDLRGRRDRFAWLAEAGRAKVDDGARRVEAVMEDWLARPRERPFFWFVNLLECHSPYLPPRPYGDVSLAERLRAAEDARNYYTLWAIWSACAGVRPVPEETLERMRRLYRASIRYMDDWVGRVLERLDRAGVLDETLVIVFSDHGENLGENGLIAHALSLDNRLIHVPFVLSGPGAEDAAITSLAELPALVARATGLEDHPWREPLPAGFGVAQFDPSADPDDPEHMRRLAEVGLGEAVDLFTQPLTCAVASGLKLLRRGESEEVFDLVSDPLETRALTAGDPALRGREEELEALRAALEHPAVVAKAGVTAAPAEASPEEVEDLEARMRMLGYM